jgi:hypothetical protein
MQARERENVSRSEASRFHKVAQSTIKVMKQTSTTAIYDAMRFCANISIAGCKNGSHIKKRSISRKVNNVLESIKHHSDSLYLKDCGN